jgi:hypothetical protein
MTVWALGGWFSPMAHHFPSALPRFTRPGPVAQLLAGMALALAIALVAIGPSRLIAQIEGERGIAPLAGTSDIQVGGIEVNTTGKDADEARQNGWKEAQRKAWAQLRGSPMGDAQIDSMVSAIVIEREQIGPRRYIARLGVIFDRAKAGQYLTGWDGGNVARARSAPLLVIPVLVSGGVEQVYEVRGAWQRAWAAFQPSASPIDYVRPSGAGGDSLLLTAGQPSRRSRLWWRTLLDQFGASDVVIPVARLERQWPGGPVRGHFTARYGPDNIWFADFTLTTNDEAGVPAMLDKAVVQMDRIYADALGRGLLKPDPTLVVDQSAFQAALAAIRAAIGPLASETPEAVTPGAVPSAAATAAPTVTTFTVQFASPDASAVDAALGAVRGAPGAQGASTTSIAIGGTSVMRVSFAGSLDALAAALRARGWQVTVGSNALSIRR